ncbi:SlyX protein [Moraxella caviae]|uniref:SlyX n=1 Tax=Moraxella caviae TaxID=34060 RepID=A0A1T0A6X1_9GAMM|nr:SlyX family protein [Moraxella caviae]OOR91505.1 SlyX protein [Moraxella caviae]STZ14411.1 SlyX [Moraxella caviae]VEW10502.1 SlyX [Moraxella caviae]
MTDITEQLIDLQTKISYLEHTVDTLNDIVARQDRTIGDLQDQLKLMYGFLKNKDGSDIAPFDLLADKPPHY